MADITTLAPGVFMYLKKPEAISVFRLDYIFHTCKISERYLHEKTVAKHSVKNFQS